MEGLLGDALGKPGEGGDGKGRNEPFADEDLPPQMPPMTSSIGCKIPRLNLLIRSAACISDRARSASSEHTKKGAGIPHSGRRLGNFVVVVGGRLLRDYDADTAQEDGRLSNGM